MRCVSCEAENPETAKFCSACGTALPISCTSCGQLNRAGSRFCNQCGTALAAKPTPPPPPGIAVGHAVDLGFIPEGERKLVTALFVDIINSTGLEQDLDPEEARAIIDPALGLMIELGAPLRRSCRAIDRRRHLRLVWSAGCSRRPSAAFALCRVAAAGGHSTPERSAALGGALADPDQGGCEHR